MKGSDEADADTFEIMKMPDFDVNFISEGDDTNGQTLLMCTTIFRRYKVLAAILEMNPTLENIDYYGAGGNAFFSVFANSYRVEEEALAAGKLLHSQGANPWIANADGKTALHEAAGSEETSSMCEWLLTLDGIDA